VKIFVNNLMECKMCKKNIQVLKKMGSGESGHMSESRFSLGWQKKGVSLVLILGVYFRPLGMFFFFSIQTSYMVNPTYLYISTISSQAGSLYIYRGLVSEETVMLRRWGSDTRKFGLSTELIM